MSPRNFQQLSIVASYTVMLLTLLIGGMLCIRFFESGPMNPNAWIGLSTDTS